MKPILVIQQRHVELPIDDFYRALHTVIDRASPPSHMSADFRGNPLAFGLVVHPPKVYEVIRNLKKQQEGRAS